MKSLIIVTLAVISTYSSACTDFTGSYTCESVDHKGSTNVYKIDIELSNDSFKISHEDGFTTTDKIDGIEREDENGRRTKVNCINNKLVSTVKSPAYNDLDPFVNGSSITKSTATKKDNVITVVENKSGKSYYLSPQGTYSHTTNITCIEN